MSEQPRDSRAQRAQEEHDADGEHLANVEEQARRYGNKSAAYDNAVLAWLFDYRAGHDIDAMLPDSDVYRGGTR